MATRKRKKVDMSSVMEDEDPEFQIAPMIDVLLVLLIFFMSITTTNVLQKDKDIVLPEAPDSIKAESKTGMGEAIINITWDGKNAQYKLDDSIVPANYLPQELSSRKTIYEKANPKGRYRVLVRADENVQYRFTQELMQACARANISAITFSVIKVGEYTRGGTDSK